MNMLPSLGIFRPLGQPAYSAAKVHSPFVLIEKIRPKGISTHQRLPLRSNDGPSRKLSSAAPWRLGSDQAVRRLRREFAGREGKSRTSCFFIAWKGLRMEFEEG